MKRNTPASRSGIKSYALRIASVFLLAFVLFAEDTNAQCAVTSLSLNTGQYVGIPVPLGTKDNFWIISAKSSAYGTVPPVGGYGEVTLLTGWGNGTWISDTLPHGNTSAPPAYLNDYMCFKRTFKLCGNDNVTFHLDSLNVDNRVDWIKVDGTVVSISGVPQGYTTGFSFLSTSFTQYLTTGTHSIEIAVYEDNNPGSNPVGMSLRGSISASTPIIVNDNNPKCLTCSSAPCEDICYWTVYGNNIANSHNVLGTLTPDDIRIVTNSNPVGIITQTGRFGFGTVTPANKVEITQGTSGFSGLRFTNLTSASAATGSSGKVLSVNSNGDVVLETAGGGAANANNGTSMSGSYVQLGQECGKENVAANLLNDREIPMNENNLIFRDGGSLSPYKNRIGLGTKRGSCSPTAKLDVVRNLESSHYEYMNIAVSGVNNDNAQDDGFVIGIYGEADNQENANNVGGDFYAKNGTQNAYGVRGQARVETYTENAFGGWFEACNANNNVGVYASTCNPGNGADWAGYFNGDLYSTTAGYISSDVRIKQNIQPITNALELINKIQPKVYEFNTAKYPALHLPTTKDNYGVIAQDLEKILPTLVKEAHVPNGKNGMSAETIKTVNYTALIPILIQAVKEQQAQITDLKAALATQGLGSGTETIAVKGDGYLAQNSPNPFSIATTIKYQLPAGTQKASIGVYDMNGRELRLLPLSSEKNGSITIQGNELTPGMYLYTLIVDGKYFDSKKMILTSQ